jgi:hypothetical protein
MRRLDPLTRQDGGLLVDAASIRDADLAAIRKICLTRVQDTAPRFATWLHRWCDAEQAARARDSDKRTVGHLMCCPPLNDFDDAELAGTLRTLMNLSFHPQGEAFAQFLDRWLVIVAEMAAQRLEGRSDG